MDAIEWLDYSKPPPGYLVAGDADEPEVRAGLALSECSYAEATSAGACHLCGYKTKFGAAHDAKP